VHQIRKSLKYIASKNQKEFMKDLKTVYQASSKDIAEHYLLKLEKNIQWLLNHGIQTGKI
jgi:putative transposase